MMKRFFTLAMTMFLAASSAWGQESNNRTFSYDVSPAGSGVAEISNASNVLLTTEAATVYPQSTELHITAVPNSGYEFDKWLLSNGDVDQFSNGGYFTCTLESDIHKTAVFKSLASEWKFDGITLATGRANASPQQVISESLYFLGLNSTNTGYGVKEATKSGTLSNGDEWSSSVYAKVPSAAVLSNTFKTLRKAGETTSTTFDRSFGFNNSTPGTCYVIFSATTASEDYKFYIYHSYSDNENKYLETSSSYTTSLTEVALSCTKEGTFWINGNGGTYNVHYIKFVPETVTLPTINDDGTITAGESNLIGDDNIDIKTYYTIDGSSPTTESSPYTTAITGSGSITIRAISVNTKTGTASCVVTKVVTFGEAPSPSGDAVSVFLTAGQSNTAGRCMNENLPDYIKTLGSNNNGAYQYCNWSYTNGSTRKSESEGVFRKFWPEMESAGTPGRFAYDAIVYYWIEQALQKDFYVVKHAAGGTSIDPSCTSTNEYHWSADATWLAGHASCNTEGGTSMLKAFCDNIGKSLDALTTDGKAYDIKAMIWHQGESDRSGTGPDNYHDNLAAVVQYVRNYLVTKTGNSKYATLDFICGTVPKESKQYNKKVYDALFTLAQEDSHFHVIETSPGTFIGDQLHFDTNCAERLGIGMYNKMVDLGLVSGTKQTVPEVIYPEGQPVTLDFKTWATENVGDKSVQKALTLSTESMKALDGTTDIYKAIGCEADGDFSEFAETFALSANEVKMRGAVGLQLASNKVVTFSILNLNPGDGVTITFGAGTSGTTTLAAMSENIFLSDDATQTVLEKGAALTSKTVTYVVKSGTQIDLTFGSTGGHYINSIVITPDAVEILPTKPTVTLKTDGAEEKVYTATFLEGETLHYTSPNTTEEQTVTYSAEHNGSVDITVTKAGDLIC